MQKMVKVLWGQYHYESEKWKDEIKQTFKVRKIERIFKNHLRRLDQRPDDLFDIYVNWTRNCNNIIYLATKDTI